MLSRNERVVLGFSGGADSAALFHMLAHSGLDLSISAVHINHGLRGEEADNDEAFCARVSKEYGAGFTAYRTDIRTMARERGQTEEEAGRDFRYASFNDAAALFGASAIAVAHNRDDNAETILMRVCRGTGLLGLSGIPVKRGKIIRPLLHTSRAEIEEYIKHHNIPYRIDSTNIKNDYTRNKLRNIIIPKIQEHINPSVIDNVTEAARLFAAEDAFLNELAFEGYKNAVLNHGEGIVELSSERLKAYNAVIINRVIRMAYAALAGGMKDLTQIHVENTAKLLYQERGKRVSLSGGAEARTGNGTLVLEILTDEPNKPFSYAFNVENCLYINEKSLLVTCGESRPEGTGIKDLKKLYTIYINYDRIEQAPVFRTRLPGDRIYLAGVGRQKLKTFLNGRKLSAREKAGLFYLADGCDIIAILSETGIIRVSDSYIHGLSETTGKGFSIWGRR